MSRVAAILVALARAVALVAAIVVLVFLFVRVAPGDAVDAKSIEGGLTAEQADALRAELGLDAPLWRQLGAWVADAATGDLGTSSRYARPVADLILGAVPSTLRLAAGAFGLGVGLALVLAIGAALWPRSPFPALVDAVNVWSIALPTFCVGLVGILVFAVWLRWTPVIGNLWLPSLVIGLDVAGQIVKTLHEELKEATTSAHVRTARAKGLSPLRIVLFHLLPTAAPLTLSLSGLALAGLVGGALTMEVLFGLPGVGSLTLNAIHGRDYPLIQATMLLLAVAVVAINGATDLLQRLVDPRPAQ
jgi:peptide/nickel transport system permease protein